MAAAAGVAGGCHSCHNILRWRWALARAPPFFSNPFQHVHLNFYLYFFVIFSIDGEATSTSCGGSAASAT